MLEEKFLFSLPDGDAGIVRKTVIKKFQADRTSYVSGDTITFRLQSQGMAIDPSKSFIRMHVSVAHPDIDTTGSYAAIQDDQKNRGLIASAGIAGAIKRLRTQSFNGTTLEEIEHYNTLSAIHDKFLVSQEAKENELSGEAWMPNANWNELESLKWDKVTNVMSAGVGLDAPAVVNQDESNVGDWQRRLRRHTESWTALTPSNLHGHTAGRDVCFQLRQSGIWGGKKIVPLQHLGQVTLEMQLESPDKVFQQIQWIDGESTTVDSCGPSRMAPVADNIPDATTGLTGADIPDAVALEYTVTKVEFVAYLVELSSAMQEAMDSAVASSGLPMAFDSFYVTSSVENAAGGGASTSILSKTNWPIYKSAANVRSVYTAYVPRGCTTGDAVYTAEAKSERSQDSFQLVKPGVTNWQYRLGTTNYPDFLVDSECIGMRLAMDALPKDKLVGKRTPSVPLDKYGYTNFLSCYGYALALNGAVPGKGLGGYLDTEARTGSELAGYGIRGAGVNAFLQGVSLESTEGVELSGQSTNSGNQLSLQSAYNETLESVNSNYVACAEVTMSGAGADGGDDARNALLEVFHVMRYTRLLLIQANRNVTIKE